mmetsp:Transcript_113684/g.328258  ORF Transcript_113684/g.328258 Transcript_113684/m.328258 type:complete len:209 (+) Transcript_113684:359-985(+)
MVVFVTAGAAICDALAAANVPSACPSPVFIKYAVIPACSLRYCTQFSAAARSRNSTCVHSCSQENKMRSTLPKMPKYMAKSCSERPGYVPTMTTLEGGTAGGGGRGGCEAAAPGAEAAGAPAGGAELGPFVDFIAFRNLIGLAPHMCPCNCANATSASSASMNLTKPYPFEAPVVMSKITFAPATDSNLLEKTLNKLMSFTAGSKLPT